MDHGSPAVSALLFHCRVRTGSLRAVIDTGPAVDALKARPPLRRTYTITTVCPL